ncbi:MAG: DUF1097 domain-containing protein [Deltaproteobacteria bacterium]|nr:DUF1097 domain-containing protein [Deltaproteobacteria bacterium]
MKLLYFPLSLSVGILAALWTYCSIKLGWPTWAAFVGWAFFFVAGDDAKAIAKVGAPTLVGVLFGYLCLYGLKLEGEAGILSISIAVGVAAMALVLMMNWKAFALAPAAFGAFAVFFAVTFGHFKSKDAFALENIFFSLLALVIGIGLGYLSIKIPAWFTKSSQA